MVSRSVRAWLPAAAKGTAVWLRPPPVGVSPMSEGGARIWLTAGSAGLQWGLSGVCGSPETQTPYRAGPCDGRTPAHTSHWVRPGGKRVCKHFDFHFPCWL